MRIGTITTIESIRLKKLLLMKNDIKKSCGLKLTKPM